MTWQRVLASPLPAQDSAMNFADLLPLNFAQFFAVTAILAAIFFVWLKLTEKDDE